VPRASLSLSCGAPRVVVVAVVAAVVAVVAVVAAITIQCCPGRALGQPILCSGRRCMLPLAFLPFVAVFGTLCAALLVRSL
jgi:hypothetical protein